MQIKITKLHPQAKVPQYMRPGDAAFDLHSNTSIVLNPGEKAVIPTGIGLEIPKGFVGLIWDRSGLAAKHALTTIAGVIDSNYRGEIGVVMLNLGKEAFTIAQHDRIAQMVIQPIHEVEFFEVDALEGSERGTAGFGSTGK